MQLFLIAAIASLLFSVVQTRLRTTHPLSFNVVRRVSAIWCVCLGLIALIAGVLWMVRPGTLPSDPSIPMWGRAAITALFVFVLAVGVRGLRLPTYRIDLGDTASVMHADSAREEIVRRQDRNWWTGEPRSREDHVSFRDDA
jgi:hypothetical protein